MDPTDPPGLHPRDLPRKPFLTAPSSFWPGQKPAGQSHREVRTPATALSPREERRRCAGPRRDPFFPQG